MSKLIRLGSYLLLVIVFQACGKSERELEAQTISQPPPAETEVFVPRLFRIADSRVQLDAAYNVKIHVDGEWAAFFAELPSADRSGFETDLLTDSGFHGNLVCLNRDCSRSRVEVSYGEKKTSLMFRSQNMRPIAGELQRDCEVPIFFEYEIEQIFQELPRIELDLQYLREMEPVRVTHVKMKSWSGEESESLRAELAVDTRRIELTDDHMRKELHRLKTRGPSPLYAKSFSYGITEDGTEPMLTYIRAHYPWTGRGNMKEICYQTHLIPDLLEEK